MLISKILTEACHLDTLLICQFLIVGRRSKLKKNVCSVSTILVFCFVLFSEQASQSLLLQSTLDQFIPYKGWKLYLSEGRINSVKSAKNCIFFLNLSSDAISQVIHLFTDVPSLILIRPNGEIMFML